MKAAIGCEAAIANDADAEPLRHRLAKRIPIVDLDPLSRCDIGLGAGFLEDQAGFITL